MKSLRVHPLAVAAALTAAVAMPMSAMAEENGLQRYSPGVGGSDMTSPLVPGWYFQLPLVAYHANKLKGNDGKIATTPTPAPSYGLPNLTSEVEGHATNFALLPRLTYLSGTQFMGGNLGWTAMLPLVKRRATFLAQPQYPASTNPAVEAGLTPVIQHTVGQQNGSEIGIGDAEFSPIVHWEIGDHQTVTLAPTIVIPTGDYKATQRINTGYGNFFTFRPSLQYAFIGDGWDVGVRNVLSFNTRNKDTGYYSGTIYNLDYQLMKFVSDDVRVGLQGYVVRQLAADTCSPADAPVASQCNAALIEDGNKMSVNAAGPAVAWLKNGGDLLLEGKVLKEYGARNRFEGTAFWLTLSKPL